MTDYEVMKGIYDTLEALRQRVADLELVVGSMFLGEFSEEGTGAPAVMMDITPPFGDVLTAWGRIHPKESPEVASPSSFSTVDRNGNALRVGDYYFAITELHPYPRAVDEITEEGKRVTTVMDNGSLHSFPVTEVVLWEKRKGWWGRSNNP